MPFVPRSNGKRSGCRPAGVGHLVPMALLAGLLPSLAVAQAGPGALLGGVAASARVEDGMLEPVVIRSVGAGHWQTAGTVDSVDGEELRAGQMQVNLSEGLARVPGLVIQNRQNYAQDLQISVRGFGARSTFGVRGVRLYVDGIPASAPDGQGQASNFPLGSAGRIDVVRGPQAVLYGSSAGGALALYTEDGGAPGVWRSGMAVDAGGLWRLSTQLQGRLGETAQVNADTLWGYSLDVSRFALDGARPQSAADRSTVNLKLSRSTDAGGRVVLQYQQQQGFAQDPLGLSRAELDANPRQTTPVALQFDTRKSMQQRQWGAAWQQPVAPGQRIELMAYMGRRSALQFQSIPPTAQKPPTSSGGVIDLDREYMGGSARWRLDQELGASRLGMVAGLAFDQQIDRRRGYENFIGSTLGVQGALRRDERNTARNIDPFAQVEWSREAWTLSAGVRYTRVRFASSDYYIAPGNLDDSGTVRYGGLLPVIGLRLRLSPAVQAYASLGRGLETPTLNEVAYRPSGLGGLNTSLEASSHRSAEFGLRGRHGGSRWNVALFEVRSRDEISVLSNTGGRSTFQNASRTLRRGLELSGDAQWGRITASAALTLMQAHYLDSVPACASASCTVPSQAFPAGNRIPGIPQQQFWAQWAWEPGVANSVWTVELRHVGTVAVDDRNSDRAAAYTIVNLGVRFAQRWGTWELREFVRIDNLANRHYVGSVIVNEGNGRFFEPGARRALQAGITLEHTF